MNRPMIAISAASVLALAAPLLAAADTAPNAAPSSVAHPAPHGDGPEGEPANTPPTDDPAIVSAGERAFTLRCAGCHGAIGSQTPTLAPKLAGIVGRAAGTAEGRYSTAMTASGITWSRERINAFLAAPTVIVPGTRMAVGLAPPAQRTAVIAYLAATAPPSPAPAPSPVAAPKAPSAP